MITKNFKDHSKVLNEIKKAQEAETDMRQDARDAKLFLNKTDGQWDPYAIEKMEGRYRGTFDMCTPIVDNISGEIEESDFSLKVSPSGGDSSVDVAKTYNGLIRNIRNISNADTIFNEASRSNVVCGFDAWEVVQEYIDGNSFDQDLIIKKIPNALDSVWFDIGSVERDRSDAKWAVKLISIPAEAYKAEYPKGSNLSISDDKQDEAFYNRADFVTIGQIYYKKPINIELAKMSNGAVYEIDDEYSKIKDDLAVQGISEVDTRVRKSHRVYSRILDGGDWLADEEETVFNDLPIIPVYGNFEIFENKSIYFGKLKNLFDQQRALNYAMSRDIEDGALSPKRKYWATDEQIEGYEDSIGTLNTNNDPVQLYNHVDNQPPPFVQGGVDASSGLQTTVGNMQQMIQASSNSFQSMQGNANPLQSGIAGSQQIEQGNIGSIKWFKALEVAVCQTGKVIVNAIPRVYDGTRQVRILEEDGTSKMTPINDVVIDKQTNQLVEVNDLTKGDYDVVCDFGPAFNNQQKETTQAFLDMAQIDPTFLQEGKDIMLKNLSVPGMDQMAERSRVQMIANGLIPESQLTDEEKQEIAIKQQQAAQQPPQEDPMMIAARAEEGKAQAEMTNAQNKQFEIQSNAQIKMKELQLREQEIELDTQKFLRDKDDKYNVDAAKIQQGNRKLDLDEYKLSMQQQKQEMDAMLATIQQQQQELNDSFTNLKTLKDAIGVEAVVGPNTVNAYQEQVETVQDKQEDA